MGVFLRWGVFAILAIAALMYAYNASKQLSSRPPAASAPVPTAVEVATDQDESQAERAEAERESVEEELVDLPPVCDEEREIAERALKMRRDGEALDRLLRIDRIAFQSDAMRRARLEDVARYWFERPGADPDSLALRTEAAQACREYLSRPASPAP